MKSASTISIGLLVSAVVVTGQDLECQGSCADTFERCAGGGIPSGTLRPCCKATDHCVERDAAFSQCRPISEEIPPSWPSGAILTCTDPACDPTQVAARFGGLSAFLRVDNEAIRVGFFDIGDLDARDTTCLQECQANDDCFAFDLTADEDCSLFGKNLFTLDGFVQPFFDAEVFLTKCFFPEPLCDPATREVRQVNPLMRDDGEPHMMAASEDEREFFVTDTPASYVLTAAINACRLQDALGGCIGFAIEGPSERGSYVVTPLLDARSERADTVPFTRGADAQVFSIEGCF